MKNLFFNSAALIVIGFAFVVPRASAGEPAAAAAKEAAADVSFKDPKAAYRSYIEAVRRMDLEAALGCWVYEPDQEEAMKVVAGVWIAHRRFAKAVDAALGEKADKAGLEGCIRPDVTDHALDAAAGMLAGAEVKTSGETTELIINWDDLKGNPEECFLSGDQPAFRKVDGQWKLTPVTRDGSLLGDGDFFAKGGWGNMFRDGIAMLNEASAKLGKGEFRTSGELKGWLAEREKAMKERNEREKQELIEEEKALPRPQ